ncbi:hypothetical protein COF09_16570 [Bacillus toyonensis]|uniref:hypothetical protein n=1 Tax=Bacillus toyonensis TaxID=155322 RepID=UPI000BFB3B3D|nr:hypothetical protein [Bacillus toyonensis]PHC41321.1 hypothetical protein COF09_16570 [Bacillus toyonensis]
MKYIYFVGFSAIAVEARQQLFGNMEHSTENEITTLAQTNTIVEEITNHYEGKFKDITVIGLHLLRKEE